MKKVESSGQIFLNEKYVLLVLVKYFDWLLHLSDQNIPNTHIESTKTTSYLLFIILNPVWNKKKLDPTCFLFVFRFHVTLSLKNVFIQTYAIQITVRWWMTTEISCSRLLFGFFLTTLKHIFTSHFFMIFKSRFKSLLTGFSCSSARYVFFFYEFVILMFPFYSNILHDKTKVVLQILILQEKIFASQILLVLFFWLKIGVCWNEYVWRIFF